MNEVNIGIVGCSGRMGIALLKICAETESCVIAGGTERPGHEAIGRDIGGLFGGGDLGIMVSDDPAALFAASDVVLDFTSPAASVVHAQLAAKSGTALILGTTGMEPEQNQLIADAAAKTTIMQSGNMSLGVNLLAELVKQAAAALDADFDIEVVEMHHRHKVDAPSGTALLLGKAAATGRDVDHDSVAVRGRDGITGARHRGDIGYASLRGGNVAGEHSVIFAADDERIELSHKATDRVIFARGAIRAALWTKGQPPGLYAMKDVLGL